MRVVLRNTKSGLFFQENETWTGDLKQARCFKHSAEAMDLARQVGLQEVEILLAFEQPPRQVTLSLDGGY